MWIFSEWYAKEIIAMASPGVNVVCGVGKTLFMHASTARLPHACISLNFQSINTMDKSWATPQQGKSLHKSKDVEEKPAPTASRFWAGVRHPFPHLPGTTAAGMARGLCSFSQAWLAASVTRSWLRLQAFPNTWNAAKFGWFPREGK